METNIDKIFFLASKTTPSTHTDNMAKATKGADAPILKLPDEVLVKIFATVQDQYYASESESRDSALSRDPFLLQKGYYPGDIARTIWELCLVSKAFNRSASQVLYRRVELNPENILRFLCTIVHAPSLAACVNCVYFEIGSRSRQAQLPTHYYVATDEIIRLSEALAREKNLDGLLRCNTTQKITMDAKSQFLLACAKLENLKSIELSFLSILGRADAIQSSVLENLMIATKAATSSTKSFTAISLNLGWSTEITAIGSVFDLPITTLNLANFGPEIFLQREVLKEDNTTVLSQTITPKPTSRCESLRVLNLEQCTFSPMDLQKLGSWIGPLEKLSWTVNLHYQSNGIPQATREGRFEKAFVASAQSLKSLVVHYHHSRTILPRPPETPSQQQQQKYPGPMELTGFEALEHLDISATTIFDFHKSGVERLSTISERLPRSLICLSIMSSSWTRAHLYPSWNHRRQDPTENPATRDESDGPADLAEERAAAETHFLAECCGNVSELKSGLPAIEGVTLYTDGPLADDDHELTKIASAITNSDSIRLTVVLVGKGEEKVSLTSRQPRSQILEALKRYASLPNIYNSTYNDLVGVCEGW